MLALSPFRLVGVAMLLILVFFVCSLTGLLTGNDLRDGYTVQSVPMVDPAGHDPERDLTYSEANVNNSEANLNNAKAVKELAVATSVLMHAEYDDPLYVHKEITSETNGAFTNGMLFVVGAIFVFVILFVAFGMMNGGKKDGNENTNLSRQ